MNDETDTWYVLADGTHAHPSDVAQGEDGVLRHKENGVHVALRDNGLPLTSGVATKSNKMAAEAAPDAGENKAKGRGKGRETKPADNRDAKRDADAEAARIAAEADAKGRADAEAEAKNREMKAGEGAKTYETR